jgi:DNA-binding Lrp family transcriptional regulator
VLKVATAFVLIHTDLGIKTDVMKELKTIKEVKEAHRVYGVYDIIARIEAGTMMDLKDIISEKIRHLYGVRSTITMITL